MVITVIVIIMITIIFIIIAMEIVIMSIRILIMVIYIFVIVKDTIKSLRTVCWKTPIFQSKQPMTKQNHILLSSQFTVALNDIICFSAQFCDNWLLMLKMRFLVFILSQAKRYKDFSVTGKY